MKCPFVIGQRVVCLQDNWADRALMVFNGQRWSLKKHIYRIRAMRTCFDDVGLMFEEIKNPLIPGISCEIAFHYEYFAPLQERPKEASIEVFRKILRGIQVTEDA